MSAWWGDDRDSMEDFVLHRVEWEANLEAWEHPEDFDAYLDLLEADDAIRYDADDLR